MKKLFALLTIFLMTACTANNNSASNNTSAADYANKELEVKITYSVNGGLKGQLTNKSDYILCCVRNASFTCKADNNYSIQVNVINSPSSMNFLEYGESFTFSVEDYKMTGKWTDEKSHTYSLEKVNKGKFSYGPKKGNGTLDSDYCITWGRVERIDTYNFKQYFTPTYFDISFCNPPRVVVYPTYSGRYGVQGYKYYEDIDTKTIYKKNKESVLPISFTPEEWSKISYQDYIDGFEFKLKCSVQYDIKSIGLVCFLGYTLDEEEHILDVQRNIPGSPISVPPTPVVDGYTFKGWYADRDLTKLFDFETFMIEGIIDVYAKLERK